MLIRLEPADALRQPFSPGTAMHSNKATWGVRLQAGGAQWGPVASDETWNTICQFEGLLDGKKKKKSCPAIYYAEQQDVYKSGKLPQKQLIYFIFLPQLCEEDRRKKMGICEHVIGHPGVVLDDVLFHCG